MIRAGIAWLLLLASSPGLRAGDASPAETPDKPLIRIIINPEARVSVTEIGAFPDLHSGRAIAVPVSIINQGFVTGMLEAELVGNAPAWVTLELRPERLKGGPTEMRIMRLLVGRPGTADITIAFRLHSEAPDLGGRDRIHFLVRCL